MKPKVAIIGDGNVGGALHKGLQRAGYELRTTGKDARKVREAGAWAEVIILAVPFSAIEDTVAELGDSAAGKTLIDATNALSPDYQLAIGFSTSGAEELQKKAPRAKVVKAFNTVFAANMSTGKVKGESLSVLAAGDDAKAKEHVLTMARDIGFDAVDAGPLVNARWLETLGFLNIQLGFSMKMGTDIGFKLVH
jgi:8-hydroxy-5-deazaflavin:NADPH oxidoreductase